MGARERQPGIARAGGDISNTDTLEQRASCESAAFRTGTPDVFSASDTASISAQSDTTASCTEAPTEGGAPGALPPRSASGGRKRLILGRGIHVAAGNAWGRGDELAYVLDHALVQAAHFRAADPNATAHQMLSRRSTPWAW